MKVLDSVLLELLIRNWVWSTSSHGHDLWLNEPKNYFCLLLSIPKLPNKYKIPLLLHSNETVYSTVWHEQSCMPQPTLLLQRSTKKRVYNFCKANNNKIEPKCPYLFPNKPNVFHVNENSYLLTLFFQQCPLNHIFFFA